jgi:hypothetical protein
LNKDKTGDAFMSELNDQLSNREIIDQDPPIEDLRVSADQAEAVKGGPVEIKELTIRVHVDA